PRPFTPRTATRTFSPADPRSRNGDALSFLAPIATPRPATAVVRIKSLRGNSFGESMLPRWLFQLANLDVPEPHDVVVILQHDAPGTARREPRRILRILALGECRVELGGAVVELDDLLPIQPVLAVGSSEHDSRPVPLPRRIDVLLVVRG